MLIVEELSISTLRSRSLSLSLSRSRIKWALLFTLAVLPCLFIAVVGRGEEDADVMLVGV
jgi:hypothetical protein